MFKLQDAMSEDFISLELEGFCLRIAITDVHATEQVNHVYLGRNGAIRLANEIARCVPFLPLEAK